MFTAVRVVSAEEYEKFINIVNPIRISSYNPDPVASLISQLGEIKKRSLPATWLATYDVLDNPKLIKILTDMDKNQEVGIFLEITPNFSSEAGVKYNETGSWHHASSVFLSGYSQSDRIKLIDFVFEKFKTNFGYYPKSVGAWWIDSFSLEYLNKKYGVVSNLTCADQFSTDGYQIWGTYWSTPYYPSKINSGMPNQTKDNKIGIVNIQWAHRDPGNGYQDSRYSTQDYFTTPQKNIEYFSYLVDLYLDNKSNQFGQITIGLEGDFLPTTYQGEYSKQLDVAVRKANNSNAKIVKMSDFSDWYIKKFIEKSPNHNIKGEISWFNTPYFRIGYKENPLRIVDLRVYSEFTKETYYNRINSRNKLEINLPSLIDSHSRKGEELRFSDDSKINLFTDKIEIENYVKNSEIRHIYSRPGVLVTQNDSKLTIQFSGKPLGTGDGVVVKDWSSESKFFFKQLKFPLLLLKSENWKMLSKIPLSISQDEIEALEFLRQQPDGRVLVHDSYCLQCKWSGQFKPSVYENNRGYIKKYSTKQYVKNRKVFEAKDRMSSLNEFNDLNVKYIYLAKYEGNSENLPFSPGDLKVDLLFENANAQIWVKK